VEVTSTSGSDWHAVRVLMKRKMFDVGCRLIAAIVVVVTLPSTAVRSQGNIVPGTPKMTAAEYDALFQANNNWGRWGEEDRLGTYNLIPEAKRRQAAALVKQGISVSIAHDLSTERAADNPSPLVRVMAPSLRLD